MYNSLTGTITSLTDSSCCIDVGGVEYILSVSSGAVQGLKTGIEARVLVYLHHKEDVQKLYGFADEGERTIFLKLLKVSGVGPSLAMKILSGLPARTLAAAIEQGDVGSLSSIPGLGKKTAQKIILALQGSLVQPEAGGGSAHGDIVSALVDMGFERSAAAEAIRLSALELPEGLSAAEAEERLFRMAIVSLSRSGGA